ncbi:hypothetical protein CDL15_Pgr017711 [Punica granatum]|uniref:DOG1 domain-containing protein n=1 Tax=Punica granatum TaxID=22663 RepID=A0A218WH49_PUNGR|nr:hypothetical protein CDL15_Pgr017711 [Punica granatum]
MPRSVALFRFRKTTRHFKSYHGDWFNELRNKLLPRLSRSLSCSATSLDELFAHVAALLCHFQTYYTALDRAATPDQVPFLLNPPWRGPLEKAFLFLGDLHPYLFTNLLRSFLDNADGYGDSFKDYELGYHLDFNNDGKDVEKQWQMETVWKNPSESLKPRIEEIERGLRLMVPALLGRLKAAQMRFVDCVAAKWPENDGNERAAVVRVAAVAEMEELARVFKDVNRLRRSTISEIVAAMTTYEAALFLQALAQFVVGLRNLDLAHKSGQ